MLLPDDAFEDCDERVVSELRRIRRHVTALVERYPSVSMPQPFLLNLGTNALRHNNIAFV
jgi:hypothetical protein